ncbi:MAG: TetR/AcrR family transcriptional regulator [Pseudomonadota bacterium]
MKPGPSPKYDRDTVLDMAMKVFWLRGYPDTNLKEVLDRAGIGRQSLYAGFGDKHSLFLSALERYFECLLEPRIEMLYQDQSGDGLGGVRGVIDDWRIGAASADRRGCLFANTITELGRRRDPEIEKILVEGRQKVEDAFVHAFTRASMLGGISDQADPIALARLTINVADGLSMQVKISRDQIAYGNMTLDQLMKFIQSA